MRNRPGDGRRRLVAQAALVVLAGLAAEARGEEAPAPLDGLRDAATRYVASLPVSVSSTRAVDGRPTTPTTCCAAGCKDVPPSVGSDCAGAMKPYLATGLGLVAGAGLGLGLGARGEAAGSEFLPFELADSLITAGAAAIAWKGYKLVDREPPPLCQGGFSGCRDGQDALGSLDARVRRAWAWPSLRGRATADALSDGTLAASFALSAGFLLGADQPHHDRELWLTVESAALTGAVLQVVKHRARRPRPYAHYCQAACGRELGEPDSQLSFFSGHTALAFSLAVSTGTIASMRSYRNAGWVLGSGLALAVTTGYLRIAADQHYFTDVVTGAVVGAAIGWAVPHLHGTRGRQPGQEATARREGSGAPGFVLPVPLRGPGGGLWLHAGIGGNVSGLAVSLSF